MLTMPVLTGSDGSFDITGKYTCGQSAENQPINSPSNQVYLVATLGDPGLNPAATNPALSMVTALGDCSKLPNASYVEVNEITTAAAAWALAPFSTSYASIGAKASNVSGIQNAFLDAALLADSSTGLPATLASNLTVESAKLISLANAIASCVNSDGATGCMPLFTAATPAGSLVGPADTFAAALNIVQNPGQNVEAVFKTIGDRPPFAGGLTTWPNDWTMSLTVTGGGMNSPTAMAIDAASNVWVVSQNGPLSAFNAQGTPLSATGYGAGVLDKSQGIAVDTHGDIWVTDYNAHFAGSGAVIKFLGVNSGATGPLGTVVENGSNPGFVTDIYYPFAVSADTNGNVFIANEGNGSGTVLTTNGSVYVNADNVSGGYLGGTQSAFPNDIAVDASDGFWIPDGNYSVIHISADGVAQTTTCCYTSYGLATDSYKNVWVANLLNDSISEVGNDGTLLLDRITGGGLDFPEYVAVDAAQNVWVSNLLAAISEFAGQGNTLAAGTPISPSTGAHGAGGYGLDSDMSEPNYIAPDRSGNLWVSNQSNNSITMFYGIAAPTATPIQPIPTAP
jgi:sugar lactone lactonase YvrE